MSVWTRQEAVKLINALWDKCQVHGYYIALTGSVLLYGESDNDLDLVLYPSSSLHTDYRPVIDIIAGHVGVFTVHAVERKANTDYKLVVGIVCTDKRRIELFIPAFAFSGRLDNYPTTPGGSTTKP